MTCVFPLLRITYFSIKTTLTITDYLSKERSAVSSVSNDQGEEEVRGHGGQGEGEDGEALDRVLEVDILREVDFVPQVRIVARKVLQWRWRWQHHFRHLPYVVLPPFGNK